MLFFTGFCWHDSACFYYKAFGDVLGRFCVYIEGGCQKQRPRHTSVRTPGLVPLQDKLFRVQNSTCPSAAKCRKLQLKSGIGGQLQHFDKSAHIASICPCACADQPCQPHTMATISDSFVFVVSPLLLVLRPALAASSSIIFWILPPTHLSCMVVATFRKRCQASSIVPLKPVVGAWHFPNSVCG